MEQLSTEAQVKCKQMWDAFNAGVKAEGFSLILLPIIKQEILDGMSKREQNLIALITNTYLTGAITFQPIEPAKPSDELVKPDDNLKK